MPDHWAIFASWSKCPYCNSFGKEIGHLLIHSTRTYCTVPVFKYLNPSNTAPGFMEWDTFSWGRCGYQIFFSFYLYILLHWQIFCAPLLSYILNTNSTPKFHSYPLLWAIITIFGHVSLKSLLIYFPTSLIDHLQFSIQQSVSLKM